MRVLLVGASGTIGTLLVPQLRKAGHEVIGTSRSSAKARSLRQLGAKPVSLDALDSDSVRKTVNDAQPDAIIYQATAMAGGGDLKACDRRLTQTNRLRTTGVDTLITVAQEAGVNRIVAQSYACHRFMREGGPVKTEDEPIDLNPPPSMKETLEAVAHVDQIIAAAGGIALRYGRLYGDSLDPLITAVRTRKFPIIGKGGGVWSFVHVEDAAAATVLALEHQGPSVYNIVDDEPVSTSVWLTYLAGILGAKPPRRLPRTIARLIVGEAPVIMSTESRGASNAKAKRELGWTLRHPSWREGFAAAYGHPDHDSRELRDNPTRDL